MAHRLLRLEHRQRTGKAARVEDRHVRDIKRLEAQLERRPIRPRQVQQHEGRPFDGDGVPTVVDDFSGNTIPGTVEHLLFGELAYTHPSGWYGALDVIYVGEQFANNSNSVKVDSYTVANLRLGLERTVGSSIVSPFIGINNLFDESYNADIRINAFSARYFEPAPELNVYAGVSVNFDLR